MRSSSGSKRCMMNYTKGSDIRNIVAKALKEDIGSRDITTDWVIPSGKLVEASLLAKEDCVVCGLGVVCLVFKQQDKNIKFKSQFRDGDFIKKEETIAVVSGKARAILTAERVALNFLSLLSGIATKTRSYVNRVKPYKTKIMDTRKTIPGLRLLEKYAVRIGGGFNHRFSLDEMLLIKDNHQAIFCNKRDASNISRIIRTVRDKNQNELKLEIEVRDLREFKEALREKPDTIMLDNMNLSDIKKAVKTRNDRQYSLHNTLLEASGGITLNNVRKVASCGVDLISVGDLTHSIKSVDISLEII